MFEILDFDFVYKWFIWGRRIVMMINFVVLRDYLIKIIGVLIKI